MIWIKKYVYQKKEEGTNEELILTNIRKDIISANFSKNDLYDNDKKIIIEEGKSTFTITTKKQNENTLINIRECENKLKEEYNLENINDLIIFIIEIQIDDNTENKKIGYEIYAEKERKNILTKLDLNICGNIIKNDEISKCSNYSIESIKSDLCISCYDNFYPIYSNILNQNFFLKCYQLPKGYYLNEKDNLYKKNMQRKRK